MVQPTILVPVPGLPESGCITIVVFFLWLIFQDIATLVEDVIDLNAIVFFRALLLLALLVVALFLLVLFLLALFLLALFLLALLLLALFLLAQLLTTCSELIWNYWQDIVLFIEFCSR
jgi:hypothetical protein